ncbi:MAG: carbohydrate kinase family protein [Planctomycetota bacterium]
MDSTGAGDVFHAAFIYGLLAAWDMQRILRFASWAGASACREIGARKGILAYETVHQFMRNDHG